MKQYNKLMDYPVRLFKKRLYYRNNQLTILQKQKIYIEKHYESYQKRHQESTKRWAAKNPNHKKIKNIEWRTICLMHYSNGTMKCSCCGVNHYEFLALDHICGLRNWIMPRRIKPPTFYNWLIKNNFPDGLRVLCHNCNWAVRFGVCPHKTVNLPNENKIIKHESVKL